MGEVASSRHVRLDRHSPRAVCQVTEDSQSPDVLTGSETLEEIMRRLLPKPTAASEGGPFSIGSGAAHTALAGGHTAGCFSCGVWTHTTDQCQTLDESFPFLPTGWQADRIGVEFFLRPGLEGPSSKPTGNAD